MSETARAPEAGIGRRRWAVAEGYIPQWSHGPEPAMASHESVGLLNAGPGDAHVTITLYFSDREPVGPYQVAVPARRTRHVRFNDLSGPGAGAAGHRVLERHRVRCSHCRATHAFGLPPGGERADDHRRLSCRLMTGGSGMPARAHE
jgi:hypothetical protein